MAEDDKKKWYVNRIEHQLNVSADQSHSRREYFKSQADRILTNITSWRTTILAGVTFGATLILGLSSVRVLSDFVIPLLLVDILLGISTFVVYTAIKHRVSEKLSSIDSSLVNKTQNRLLEGHYGDRNILH